MNLFMYSGRPRDCESPYLLPTTCWMYEHMTLEMNETPCSSLFYRNEKKMNNKTTLVIFYEMWIQSKGI